MPLPKPTASETRTDFMARCMVNPNIRADFDTIDQRAAVCNSLWEEERDSEMKAGIFDYPAEFEKRLVRAESKSIRNLSIYYQEQFFNAVDMFLRQGAISSADTSVFFKESEIVTQYENIYETIGIDFATWYAKIYPKLQTKSFKIDEYKTIWIAAFRYIGNQIGKQWASTVSNTAQATIIATTKRYLANPEFNTLGEKEKSKILRKKFTSLADYQARRVVRTEGTFAANYASQQAALDVFAGQDLVKRWYATFDDRTRDAHLEAHGQTVPAKNKFKVGGEELNLPGDPSSSAANRINCRCKASFLPIETATAIGTPLTSIAVGLAINSVVEELV